MKTYALAVTDEALNELQAAVDYYEDISESLAVQFGDAFDKTVQSVLVTPYARNVRYGVVRFAQVKPFAEDVHFSIDEASSTVIVVGVVSHHRNPDATWRRSPR